MQQQDVQNFRTASFLWDECIEFVMSEFGLEAIESEITETVLIAEYDGGERKDYRDVRCPAIRGSTSSPGMLSCRISQGTHQKNKDKIKRCYYQHGRAFLGYH